MTRAEMDRTILEALVDGFVVFVKEVKVGEKVKIKIQDVKPNFAFADVKERLGKV